MLPTFTVSFTFYLRQILPKTVLRGFDQNQQPLSLGGLRLAIGYLSHFIAVASWKWREWIKLALNFTWVPCRMQWQRLSDYFHDDLKRICPASAIRLKIFHHQQHNTSIFSIIGDATRSKYYAYVVVGQYLLVSKHLKSTCLSSVFPMLSPMIMIMSTMSIWQVVALVYPHLMNPNQLP